MKSFITLFLSLSSLFSFGQKPDYFEIDRAPHCIKISPFQFSKAFFEMSYEHLFKNDYALQLAPTLMLNESSDEDFVGFQLDLQGRKYLLQFTKEKHNVKLFTNIEMYTGLYVLGMTFDNNFTRSYWDINQNEQVENTFHREVDAIEGGVLLGASFTIAYKVVFDLTIGGGARYSDYINTFEDAPTEYYYRTETGIFDIEYTGIKPRINFQLGILL